MKVDLMVPAHNRLEFTKTCLDNLVQNTDWNSVRRLSLYDVGSVGAKMMQCLIGYQRLTPCEVDVRRLSRMPVTNVLASHVRSSSAPYIAKIDNDTIVPPGWLTATLDVMECNPELSLLGIQAMRPVGEGPYSYHPTRFIGGIGLFRRDAFLRSVPKGWRIYFGFQRWQIRSIRSLVKGWIDPALPVCLLDHLPFEPWISLTEKYLRSGWQRQRPKYPPTMRVLWEWKWPDTVRTLQESNP